jgi:hypothetical protein
MARFFYHAIYKGRSFVDEQGEVFSDPDEAHAHAMQIAAELGRNNLDPVTVILTSEDGTELQRVHAGEER